MQSAQALAPIADAIAPTWATKAQIVDLLHDVSIEITPAAATKYSSIGPLLSPGTRVYVAYVPGEDHRQVVATAVRLRSEGLVPVPHLPARSIVSRAVLEDALRQFTTEAGVREVLVIGGGIDEPRGPFNGTLDLLQTGLLEDHGIRAIGLAGHPEGQRELAGPGVATTTQQKLAYAGRTTASVRLVTQFVFEPEPVLDWERGLRAIGSQLPIHVGVPGPASIKSLLNYARLCGVGNSMRLLTRQGGSLFKLASLSYPDRLITALAVARGPDPASCIARLHFYPFGGLARTARWIGALQAGAFTLHEDGLGFTADVD
jgi:methylenetetrahydrofolate reductase (NADPH)